MADIRLRYQAQISSVSGCPAIHCVAINGNGTLYRLVPQIAVTEDAFVPPAALNPKRSFKNATERCSGFALSFFDSPANVRNHYQRLSRSVPPNTLRLIGSFVAECNILPGDGLAGPSSATGHIDLHPSHDSQFHTNVITVVAV